VTDYEHLTRLLVENGIDFIIVGGAAATAHGSARLTLDLDIVYRRDSKNLERIVSALAPTEPYLRGAPIGLPFEWSVETLRKGLNFTLTTNLGALDLLGEIVGGGGYEQLKSHSEQVTIFGVECTCLSLDRLIEVKRAAGRPKDLEAIAELEQILNERKQ
jgi:predicted nucleotidyltransferase